jgi:hypothetical protein
LLVGAIGSEPVVWVAAGDHNHEGHDAEDHEIGQVKALGQRMEHPPRPTINAVMVAKRMADRMLKTGSFMTQMLALEWLIKGLRAAARLRRAGKDAFSEFLQDRTG